MYRSFFCLNRLKNEDLHAHITLLMSMDKRKKNIVVCFFRLSVCRFFFVIFLQLLYFIVLSVLFELLYIHFFYEVIKLKFKDKILNL